LNRKSRLRPLIVGTATLLAVSLIIVWDASAQTHVVTAPYADAVYPIYGAPPHPAVPHDLGESSPSWAEQNASPFDWIPGEWVWTGDAY